MKLQAGMRASISRQISESDLASFAALSGDTNPLHFSEEYAARTRFGRRIAHGMLSAALISGVLGTKLPGPGCIYLSQSLRFLAPVYIGETITAQVTVVSVREDKPIATLATRCVKEDGTEVLDGQAVIMFEPVDDPGGET